MSCKGANRRFFDNLICELRNSSHLTAPKKPCFWAFFRCPKIEKEIGHIIVRKSSGNPRQICCRELYGLLRKRCEKTGETIFGTEFFVHFGKWHAIGRLFGRFCPISSSNSCFAFRLFLVFEDFGIEIVVFSAKNFFRNIERVTFGRQFLVHFGNGREMPVIFDNQTCCFFWYVFDKCHHFWQDMVEREAYMGLDCVKLVDIITNSAMIEQSGIRCALGLADNYSYVNENGEKEYMNEHHRYGHRKKMNRNCVLLYLLLFFMKPDVNGYICSLDSDEAAEFLGCTRRTVENCLRKLEKSNYIAYKHCENIACNYEIFILGFKYTNPKLKKGGYLFMTKEFLLALLNARTLNELRIMIRNLILLSGKEKNEETGLTYQELKRVCGIPDSYTVKKLRAQFASGIFDFCLSVEQHAHTISMRLSPKFTASGIRAFVRKELNAFLDGFEGAGRFRLSEKDKYDISNIGLKYPFEAIKEAMIYVYNTMVVNGTKIRSAGALIRAYTDSYTRFGRFEA